MSCLQADDTFVKNEASAPRKLLRVEFGGGDSKKILTSRANATFTPNPPPSPNRFARLANPPPEFYNSGKLEEPNGRVSFILRLLARRFQKKGSSGLWPLFYRV